MASLPKSGLIYGVDNPFMCDHEIIVIVSEGGHSILTLGIRRLLRSRGF